MNKIKKTLVDKQIFPKIIFGAIIILGFLLRSKAYLQGDFNYSIDQARDLLLTREIVVNHKLTLIGGRAGFGGLFHGPLWLYIISPFFIIASGNPLFTLIPLFILVDLSLIISGYLLISRLYGKKTGLVFAFLLAISIR